MAQALINAQHQVNLATLPAFSNSVKDDQYTAAQWLQKVLLHRQAAERNIHQVI
jgi:TPR repeat protein